MHETLKLTAPSAADMPAARFLRAAQLCRARDLERLFVLGELVRSIGELIHGLQRERGASSIVLGSHGASFQEQLEAQVSACRELEHDVRSRLEQVDATLEGMSFGARFYTRGAMAFRALDRLMDLRGGVGSLKITPEDSMRAFSDIIACLLAVGFEIADIAADPQISRALIALANFSQGKEYAGQERATAGAPFSRGRFGAADKQRLRQLINAQDQAFSLFREFATAAHVAAFTGLMDGNDTTEVKRMRRIALGREPMEDASEPMAAAWFRHSTARIDAMQTIEQRMSAELSGLCTEKLAEARESAAGTARDPADSLSSPARVAMFVSDPNSAQPGLGISGGVGLYTLDCALPAPMHSILDVIHAQSKRLSDVSHELESARAALAQGNRARQGAADAQSPGH
jgi:DnaJ-domain-containing protein 1